MTDALDAGTVTVTIPVETKLDGQLVMETVDRLHVMLKGHRQDPPADE